MRWRTTVRRDLFASQRPAHIAKLEKMQLGRRVRQASIGRASGTLAELRQGMHDECPELAETGVPFCRPKLHPGIAFDHPFRQIAS
jgi:hypothetical protein